MGVVGAEVGSATGSAVGVGCGTVGIMFGRTGTTQGDEAVAVVVGSVDRKSFVVGSGLSLLDIEA